MGSALANSLWKTIRSLQYCVCCQFYKIKNCCGRICCFFMRFFRPIFALLLSFVILINWIIWAIIKVPEACNQEWGKLIDVLPRDILLYVYQANTYHLTDLILAHRLWHWSKIRPELGQTLVTCQREHASWPWVFVKCYNQNNRCTNTESRRCSCQKSRKKIHKSTISLFISPDPSQMCMNVKQNNVAA